LVPIKLDCLPYLLLDFLQGRTHCYRHIHCGMDVGSVLNGESQKVLYGFKLNQIIFSDLFILILINELDDADGTLFVLVVIMAIDRPHQDGVYFPDVGQVVNVCTVLVVLFGLIREVKLSIGVGIA